MVVYQQSLPLAGLANRVVTANLRSSAEQILIPQAQETIRIRVPLLVDPAFSDNIQQKPEAARREAWYPPRRGCQSSQEPNVFFTIATRSSAH